MARRIKDYITKSYLKYKINKILRKFNPKQDLYLIYKTFIKKSGLNKSLNLTTIKEEDLNTNYLDIKIEKIILKYYKANLPEFIKFNPSNNNKNIAVLFTELYPNGGHTPLVERIIDSFSEEFNLKAFSSRLDYTSNQDYSKKNNNIFSKGVDVDGVHFEWNETNLEIFVKNLYNKIILFSPKIIFCYIHPQDVVISATLALIKINTDIKIIDINMQDHFYSLGFKFADLIIDARPSGQRITREVRNFKKTTLMPLQQKKLDETIYFSDNEILDLKKQLKIEDNKFVTLTGGSNHKFFDDTGSEYFNLIKNLLIKQSNLVHIVMSDFDEKFLKIINNIFENNQDLLERLKIIKPVPEFDIYMQVCDIFIDTFPQGGALIHIDIMRNKKLSVVKINKENPVRSFEFYFPKNYKYKFESIVDLEKAVIYLLNNKEERNFVSKQLFEHYLETYEFEVVKQKYKKIIHNYDNLKKFYGYSFY
jgi:hypothetical protein